LSLTLRSVPVPTFATAAGRSAAWRCAELAEVRFAVFPGIDPFLAGFPAAVPAATSPAFCLLIFSALISQLLQGFYRAVDPALHVERPLSRWAVRFEELSYIGVKGKVPHLTAQCINRQLQRFAPGYSLCIPGILCHGRTFLIAGTPPGILNRNTGTINGQGSDQGLDRLPIRYLAAGPAGADRNNGSHQYPKLAAAQKHFKLLPYCHDFFSLLVN
jgi:hypothetical protein